MPDIKTRDLVKGTIKTLDKAVVTSERMKQAYIQTKDKSTESVSSQDYSPEEYASTKIEGTVESTIRETTHQSVNLGKKAMNRTKNEVKRRFENKANNNAQEMGRNTAKKTTVQKSKQVHSKRIRTSKQTTKGVKQTAKSTGSKTIKTAQKGTVKTTKISVKTAEKTSKAAIKTVEKSAKATKEAAKASAKAAEKAAQAAKATAQAAIRATKIAIKAVIAAIKAIIAGVKALGAAIAAGGWVAVIIIIVICMIALIVGSCYGIFFAGEDSGSGITLPSAISEINGEYNQQIEQLKSDNPHDILEMSGTKAEWKEVIAIYAVDKTMVDLNPANPDEAKQVATMDEEKKEYLKNLFWEMNKIEYRTENKTVTETVEEVRDNGSVELVEREVEKTTLYITVTHVSLEEMMSQKNFTDVQRDMVYELLADENNILWLDALHGITSSDTEIVSVAQAQIGNVGGQPYWSWYVFGSRVEWCACFVSWCANECGYIDAGLIPKYAVCDTGVYWFKERGEWVEGTEEPKLGMIIFFDWEYDGLDGNSDHTGIVEKVEGGRVYTIEGNASDSCMECSYPIGYYEILGYGAPAY